MKLKSIITFSILFALSFSIMHEFAFTMFEKNQCSVTEYVTELNEPIECGDVCDIHFKYHQAFMFPNTAISISKILKITKIHTKKESYNQQITLDSIIPPIA